MSKVAVIKTGGKQYLVQEGSRLKIEKLEVSDSKVSFGDILMVAETDGSKIEIGKPTVKTNVSGEVVKQGRARKITVIHYKPKVRYHKKQGHRQPFTEIKVTNIN